MRYVYTLLMAVSLFVPSQVFSQEDTSETAILFMPDDTSKVSKLYALAFENLYADRQKAHEQITEIYAIAARIKDDESRLKGQYLEATALHFAGKEDEALTLCLKSVKEARQKGFRKVLAPLLNSLCQIYQSKNQLEKSLEAIMESLEISIDLGNRKREAIAYHTIASTYHYLNEIGTARKYLEKALPIFTELEDWYRLGVVYQSLSILTEKEEALEYAEKGLDALLKTSDVQGQGMCYWSIGSAHYSMDNFELAEDYFSKARDVFIAIDHPEGIANMDANLSSILVSRGRYSEALPYLKSCNKIVRENGFDDIYATLYVGWSKYYAGVGEVALTHAYIDSLSAIKDSLFSKEKAAILIESEARLETREKEAQLVAQSLELEQATNTRRSILWIASFAIVGLLSFIFWYRNHQKLKSRADALELSFQRNEAARLLELDEMKSNFFTNISHEFRTPLTLILGPLDQMRKGIFKGDFNKYYEMMYRNGSRLYELINQLLDLGKLEHNKLKLTLEAADVYRVLRHIAGAFESWADRKNIALDVSIPTQPLWVQFDRDKLEKIFTNLISNALKYTQEYGHVNIDVTSTQDGNKEVLKIKVSDDGMGMGKDIQDQIFERFYQHTDLSDASGSGIGLALTKELVTLHGGVIEVESEEGLGSTFTVRLPLSKTPADYILNVPEKENTRVPFVPVSHAQLPIMVNQQLDTILIVEDNNDVRTYVKDHLQTQFNVVEAQNGKEGMDLALDLIPDLILSDVMMPVKDGIEMLTQLKNDQRTSHIPIIMLTAKSTIENKVEGLREGADDYLTKPFHSDELIARIENLISQRKSLREKFKQEFYFGPTSVEVSSEQEQFLHQVKEIIERNIANENYGVEALAKDVGFSRSQLNRKLKALVDKSPNELIRGFRLQRAKALLEQKAGTVSEIAYQVGFGNLSYFARCFKKEFGKSPSDITTDT